MFKVPVTYVMDFLRPRRDKLNCFLMQELYDLGARHLVLTDTLIEEIKMDSRGDLADLLMQQLADHGLDFVDAHAPFGPRLDLCCPFKNYRDIMLSSGKLALDICHYMGVKTICFHTGNWQPIPGIHLVLEDYIKLTEDALAELLPHAEKNDCIICIENIWFPNNTPEVLLAIKEKFPTKYLGFCYDSGHANLMDKGRLYTDAQAERAWKDLGLQIPWDDHILEKMLPHVVNCHLHDNDGTDDMHITPGKGNVDWPHIVSLLNQAPRLTSIQSEVGPIGRHCSFKEITDAFKWLDTNF